MVGLNKIVLASHYLGNLQYYSKFEHFDQVLIEQHETYSKGSYRNRCYIAGPNGRLRLSIPLLKGKNEQMPIKEVKIAYEEAWYKHHWQSIQSGYGNAPYFEYYAERIKGILSKRHTFLFDLNMELLYQISEWLGLKAETGMTASWFKEYTAANHSDLRNLISPKDFEGKNDSAFQIVQYPQVFLEKSGFLPNLSILDLLFCTGPQALIYLEQSNIINHSE